MFRKLTRYFLEGLLILAPVAATFWVVYYIISQFDLFFKSWIPGAGLLAAIVLITLTGYIASNFLTKRVLRHIEESFMKLPLLKFVYISIKDLVGAFVGDRKKIFKRPVAVRSDKDGGRMFVGFITDESMEKFGMDDVVCVYLPFSYSFAGQLMLVKKDLVTPIDAPGGDVMAFVVSGGITTTGLANMVEDDSKEGAR